jgi:hypothetical protein
MQFSPVSIKTSSLHSYGAHYFGSKIFNHPLSFIKELHTYAKGELIVVAHAFNMVDPELTELNL